MARRSRKRWATSFGAFVESHTVAGIQRGLHSAGFPVTRKAVYNWLSGAALPALPVADALIRMSGGTISTSDLLRHRSQVRMGGSGEDGPGGA